MIGIGIRVYSNTKIYYAVIRHDRTNGSVEYLTLSKLHVPISLEKPEQLSFIRNTILDIMSEYNVQRAAIRVQEFGGSLNQSYIERCYLEGVVQESLASSNVEKYIVGPISKLSNFLNTRTEFKEYASGIKEFEHIPSDLDWKTLSKERRESILACFSALNLN